MTDLDDMYNSRIFELAAHIGRTERLAAPDAVGEARSKLCGSEIAVDVCVREGRVRDYGQTVKACLLGQSAASVMGREIVGSTPAELRALRETMRGMLKEGGPPPTGRWADLAVLEPVRHYKPRHDAVMIVFDAVVRALDQIEAKAKVA